MALESPESSLDRLDGFLTSKLFGGSFILPFDNNYSSCLLRPCTTQFDVNFFKTFGDTVIAATDLLGSFTQPRLRLFTDGQIEQQ
jgi:hypothetical protein